MLSCQTYELRTYVMRTNVNVVMAQNDNNVGPFWYCIHTLHNNKKNAVISSSVILASLIITYGTQDLAHQHMLNADPLPRPPHSVQQEKRDIHTSYLCYTNDVNISKRLGRQLNFFQGKMSDNALIFLAIGVDIKHILNINYVEYDSCFTVENTFLYQCCGYSPYFEDSWKNIYLRETNFEYDRRVITDNYFRVEEILTGKPVMVDLTIKLRPEMSNHTTNVISRHRCRGDVIVDPYPEVHFEIYTNNNENSSKHEFHWYL